MGTIRDKMTADLELRGLASTTKKEYLQRAHNSLRTTGGRRRSWGNRRSASSCCTS